MKAKALSLIVLVLLLVADAAPRYAKEIPPLPHAFYCNVTINNAPAPVGTIVEARGERVRIGIPGNPIETTELGKYGSPDPLKPKLIV